MICLNDSATTSIRADRDGRVGVGAILLSVLNAEVFRFPAPWVFPAAELPYSILRLIHSGTGEIEFDGRRYAVSAGDLVLVPEGAVLACRATSADFAFGSIRFTASLDAYGRLPGAIPVPERSRVGDDSVLRASFDEVVRAWQSPLPGRSLLASGHLGVVLGRAADLAAERGERVSRPTAEARMHSRIRDPRVTRVIDYLALDLRRTPDSAALCAMVHMSESTLRRTFKQQTGKTIGAYLRELRVSAAARRLALSEESIGQIAEAVGLADANYFARSFREVFGLTPSEYRRLAGQT